MKTIWKFEIDFHNKKLTMPAGAKILTMQLQNNVICIWAEVDTNSKKEKVVFEIFNTNQEIPKNIDASIEYIETVQQGPLIWHVYKYTGV